MKTVRLALAALLALASQSAAAQEVIRLWPGKAPGSESWTVTESAVPNPDGGTRVTNVTEPTLTVYLPDKAKATGTAVIIAPGGAMRLLVIEDYQASTAKWLNERGIAAFVLKYRVMPTGEAPAPPPGPRPANPLAGIPALTEFPKGNANPFPNDARGNAVFGMAVADAHQAMRLVRGNAAAWNIDPKKVGMLGYSAGGGVALGAALMPSQGAMPDFIISAFGPSLMDVTVPANPPPLFLAVGQFHPNVAPGLVALWKIWTEAKAPAELHIYDKVSGGFGMRKQGLPVDGWLDRAHEWMAARGFAPKG